jgi:hypothetical protein
MSRPRPAEPPTRAERPVPFVVAPEGTSEPDEWATGTTGPLAPPVGDDDGVLVARQRAQSRDRDSRAAGAAPAQDPGPDPESSYTTEQSQGAAQPGPATEGSSA